MQDPFFFFLNQGLYIPRPTYMHHSNVAPLVRLKKVRHSSLQASTNENAVVDVIEEDGS